MDKKFPHVGRYKPDETAELTLTHEWKSTAAEIMRKDTLESCVSVDLLLLLALYTTNVTPPMLSYFER